MTLTNVSTEQVIGIQKVSNLLEGRNVSQESLDYANICINGNDNKLFLDPILIYGDRQRNELANRCWDIVRDYFYTLTREVAEGTLSIDSPTLEHLSEKNSFHLGHSEIVEGKNSRGNGCSPEMVYTIFERIGFDRLQEMVERQLIVEPMDIFLYVKGFGEDRMSDLITNLLFRELAHYTEEIARHSAEANDVNLQFIEKNAWYWDTEEHNWKQFTYNELLDTNNRPLTLVPKRFLTDYYRYNPQRFFRGVILTHLQEEYLRNNPGQQKISKDALEKQLKSENSDFSQVDYILECCLNNPTLSQEFRESNCHGALGNNYLGYLSDNKLTEVIELPYI